MTSERERVNVTDDRDSPTGWRRSAIVVVPCLAVGLVVAAVAGLNTALPYLAVDTGATQSQLTWIVDAYTLALACLLLPAGAIGDKYGRRGLMIAGLLVFAGGSALPLFLDTPVWIVVSRAVAGVGAAAVMPATLSVITSSYPAERRNRGVAIWAACAGTGSVFGMLGSGVALELGTWRWIFLVFAIAAVVVAVASVVVPSSKDASDAPLDKVGGPLIAVGIALFVIGLLEAPHRGWTSVPVIALLVGGLVVIGAFVLSQVRAKHPLLDVRLLLNRSFGAGSASLVVQFLAIFALFFVIVQFLQLILGFSPLMASVGMVPIACLMLVAVALSGPLTTRFGFRIVTVTGLVMVGLGLVAMNLLGEDAPYLHVALVLGPPGFGIGLCTAISTSAVVGAVPRDKQGVASAVNDLTREMGAAVGQAIAGSVLAAGYSRQIADVAAQVPEQARSAVEGSLASALEVAKVAGPQGEPLAAAAREAFVNGMHEATMFVGVLVVVLAVGVAVWAPRRTTSVDA